MSVRGALLVAVVAAALAWALVEDVPNLSLTSAGDAKHYALHCVRMARVGAQLLMDDASEAVAPAAEWLRGSFNRAIEFFAGAHADTQDVNATKKPTPTATKRPKGSASAERSASDGGVRPQTPPAAALGLEHFPFHVTWMAPFFSGGGYCSEATSFALALSERMPLRIAQHGDAFSVDYVTGLPRDVRDALVGMLRSAPAHAQQPIVTICHSEPGAWRPPLYETSLCPLEGSSYAIGRTMFETDRITPGWVERCNRMDEVWVPTDFHLQAFARSGVDPARLHKVPEAVDSAFFDPAKHAPLQLPIGQLAVGQRRASAMKALRRDGDGSSAPFAFLSVFKWEERKGWNILVEAFVTEFARGRAYYDGASPGVGGDGTDEAPVELYLLTNAFHSDDDFAQRVREMAVRLGIREDDLPPIFVIDTHVPTAALPRLYRAADCFVLPSRGEGWGRPHVEAMAMALPVIATNWSGPTEYLNEQNGYPLPIDGLVEIKTGPYRTHLWAEPSLKGLRELMRRVYERPEERVARGRRAREDVVAKYTPRAVADVVVRRLRDIAAHMEGAKGVKT